MNIVDVIILLTILFGMVAGFKNGFTKQLVSFVGFLLIIFLAFQFKNSLSIWMYKTLPFFNFGGVFKGVVVLNILVYEVLAFLIIFGILSIIFQVVLLVTSIVEKIFDFTIILGIFSKILGAIVGGMQYYLFIFIALYFFSLPIFDSNFLTDSKLKDQILTETPFLNKPVAKAMDVADEFIVLKDKYKYSKDVNSFNLEALDVFLKYKVITIENVDELTHSGKLQINNIESVLLKYRGE